MLPAYLRGWKHEVAQCYYLKKGPSYSSQQNTHPSKYTQKKKTNTQALVSPISTCLILVSFSKQLHIKLPPANQRVVFHSSSGILADVSLLIKLNREKPIFFYIFLKILESVNCLPTYIELMNKYQSNINRTAQNQAYVDDCVCGWLGVVVVVFVLAYIYLWLDFIVC